MADEKGKSSPVGVADAESLNGPAVLHGDARLVRQLKNRHIAMISIGGVIGTGQCTPSYFMPSHNPLQVSSWVLLPLYTMAVRLVFFWAT